MWNGLVATGKIVGGLTIAYAGVYIGGTLAVAAGGLLLPLGMVGVSAYTAYNGILLARAVALGLANLGGL